MVSETVLNVLRLFCVPEHFEQNDTAVELAQLTNKLSKPSYRFSHRERYQLQCLMLACIEAVEKALGHASNDEMTQELKLLLQEIKQTNDLLFLSKRIAH